MMPGDELAAGIEARLDVMRRHRPELAAGQIVLAGPDQLDRLADGHGHLHGLADEVQLGLAAQATAQLRAGLGFNALLAQMGLHLGMEVTNWPPENIDELAKKMESHY